MAKQAHEPNRPVAQREPGTALQDVDPAQRGIVPDDLLGLTEEDAGKGVSFKQEDQLIPLIYVLQKNSPIVDKRAEVYVDGAEPGHFWLRNSITPIADGMQGITAIPCGMRRTWIEWMPNRGGFITRHDEPPPDMETRTIRGDDGRERQALVRSTNGNIIQDTREFFLLVDHGMIVGQPFVLPCTSTKHSFARQWQTMFHQFRHPKTNAVMPSFARKYLLTTVAQKNALGEWYGLKFADQGFVETPVYRAARTFNQAVESGERKAEAPLAEHTTAPDSEIPF